MNLPMLPEDPVVFRSAWMSLTFILAMTGFFAFTVTVLLRTRRLIDDLITSANRQIVAQLAELESETKEQLVMLNQSNREIASSLQSLSAQGRITQERIRHIEGRVDHSDERLEQFIQRVARIEGRLNGRAGGSGGVVD